MGHRLTLPLGPRDFVALALAFGLDLKSIWRWVDLWVPFVLLALGFAFLFLFVSLAV